MKVTLRQKDGKKISLYLDIYHDGNRKYEYLKLYLYKKPGTPIQRTHNKDTLRLAENIAAKRQLDLQNKVYGFQNPDLQKASFIDYFKTLAENRRYSTGNYGNWIAAINHLQDFTQGDRKFTDIDPIFLNKYKLYLVNTATTKSGDKLSPNSASSYFNKLRAALKQATIDEIISDNPAKNVKGIKETTTAIEFLTEEEVLKLKCTPCPVPVLKSAFLFACYTGLRFSDIKKLTWSEIQESQGKMKIRFTQLKTKAPLTNPLQTKASEFLGERQGPDELVFTGLHYSDTNNKKLRQWISAAGITRHITFHDSRDTFATLALTKGTNIYTVRDLLGHKSVKTTERYAKVVDSLKEEAISKLNF